MAVSSGGVAHSEEVWKSNTGFTLSIASGNSFIVQVGGATVATFSSSGYTPASGQIISLPNGAVGAPSLTFANNLTAGLYRVGAGVIGFAIAGAKVLDISATGLGVTGAVTMDGILTVRSGTAPPAAGALTSGILVSNTANFGIFWGSGAPTLSAAQGSLYLRTDGSSISTRSYIATNGSGTWTSHTTAA